jgi:four helix bundle protein
LHFYNISQASLEELRYQFLLGKDLGYVSQIDYEKFAIAAEEVSKVISGWIRSQAAH